MGVANAITGTIIGGLFGTVFGSARYSQLKFTKMTYEDERYQRMREQIVLRE